jgi:hypothetical protein
VRSRKRAGGKGYAGREESKGRKRKVRKGKWERVQEGKKQSSNFSARNVTNY